MLHHINTSNELKKPTPLNRITDGFPAPALTLHDNRSLLLKKLTIILSKKLT